MRKGFVWRMGGGSTIVHGLSPQRILKVHNTDSVATADTCTHVHVGRSVVLRTSHPALIYIHSPIVLRISTCTCNRCAYAHKDTALNEACEVREGLRKIDLHLLELVSVQVVIRVAGETCTWYEPACSLCTIWTLFVLCGEGRGGNFDFPLQRDTQCFCLLSQRSCTLCA